MVGTDLKYVYLPYIYRLGNRDFHNLKFPGRVSAGYWPTCFKITEQRGPVPGVSSQLPRRPGFLQQLKLQPKPNPAPHRTGASESHVITRPGRLRRLTRWFTSRQRWPAYPPPITFNSPYCGACWACASTTPSVLPPKEHLLAKKFRRQTFLGSYMWFVWSTSPFFSPLFFSLRFRNTPLCTVIASRLGTNVELRELVTCVSLPFSWFHIWPKICLSPIS